MPQIGFTVAYHLFLATVAEVWILLCRDEAILVEISLLHLLSFFFIGSEAAAAVSGGIRSCA